MTAAPTTRSLDADYEARFPGSRVLFQRARQLMPSGINHDVRRIDPFPVYIDRALGSRKWDVDGNELIDYAVGHGALILGHGHPAVRRAIIDQVDRVTHASAPTANEVRWAALVTGLVPCADRVRFVLSGTEATMLALRLMRAATGRSVVVKVDGHFHGWHDYAMVHFLPPFEIVSSAGVPEVIEQTIRPVPLDDLDALERALARGDTAGVILEPDGPVVGTVPVRAGYLEGVRQLTRKYGVPLTFDEVVTGFRLAPGGAQEHFGVTPDLATFAKIIGGGAPSGAVAGRAEIMELLSYSDDPDRDRRERVIHMGTYSAHPVAAAAGCAALSLLQDGRVQDLTADLADRLRAGMNTALREAGVAGLAYGLRSCFRVVIGDQGDLPDVHDQAEFLDAIPVPRLLAGTRPPIKRALHRALFLEGIDFIGGNHGWTTAAHAEADIDASVASFARAVRRLVGEGLLQPARRGAAAGQGGRAAPGG